MALYQNIIMNKHATLEKITAWAKRRGFIFQTSTIYGGLASNYDYGPYGVLLKNNVRDTWWKKFVLNRDDIVGLDGAILMQQDVWKASGHTENFADSMVEDKVSHIRYRADHLIEAWIKKNNKEYFNPESLTIEEMTKYIRQNKILSPDGNELTDVKKFNGMFETHVGATSNEDESIVYLRPETAQAIFVNFKNILDTMRVRIPFGIGQIGKAFRNEITKGQFIFRTIETEQMEIEYFIHPKTDWEKLMQEWLSDMKAFYMELGVPEEDIRFRQHEPAELSHYSKGTYDPEYEFDFGWKEIAGLAYRTDYDLSQHIKSSKQKLEYRDPINNEVYVPHVLEPSFGLARAVLVALYSAYTEETLENGNTRIVMKFPARVAPIKVAIFPLQKDEKLQSEARDIYNSLNKYFKCEYDNSGNIGKMYRRQDEIGTPFCITIDYDSITDKSVTVRDRDTMKQERVKISELHSFISSKFE